MSRWKRNDGADLIALAAGVPDAAAVLEDGVLAGWDESAAHRYELEHGLATECGAGCARRGCIFPV